MASVGIDLGTTNSLVAYWEGDKATVIPNAIGERMTPSVVGLDDDGSLLVGAAARERLITHPLMTAAVFKRYMGTAHTFQLGDRTFKPEELSSFVLRSLKEDAEAFLGEAVDEAVISVPAYFNDQQRKMTQLAGELAGLKVERLINEPTAAAISYGLHQKEEEHQFLVFDLGGGTFDVSILSIFDKLLEVTATTGDNALGGEDFVDVIIADFMSKYDLSFDQLNRQIKGQVRAQAEYIKRQLSKQESVRTNISINGIEHLWTLDRKHFENLAKPLIAKLRQPVERALMDARLFPRHLDAVVLVGGATRMPLIRALVEKMFGFPALNHINPDETIALGAAIQAGLKARNQSLADVILTDVCPYSLGIATSRSTANGGFESGIFTPIIERNTVIPVSREKEFFNAHDHQEKISIKIYQGESRLVSNNILLGELNIDIPPMPAGSYAITIRYTYDINGILEVEVKSGSGQVLRKVIEGENCTLTAEEIAQRLEALASLKIHPRDQQENRYLMARGERLFETTTGPHREYISRCIAEFEDSLREQDLRKIERLRIRISKLFDEFELERI